MAIYEAIKRTCPVCSDTHLCAAPQEYADSSRLAEHVTEYVQARLQSEYGRPERRTQGSVLYRDYRRWASARGYVPLSNKGFARAIRAHGIPAVKASNMYYPVTLRE